MIAKSQPSPLKISAAVVFSGFKTSRRPATTGMAHKPAMAVRRAP